MEKCISAYYFFRTDLNIWMLCSKKRPHHNAQLKIWAFFSTDLFNVTWCDNGVVKFHSWYQGKEVHIVKTYFIQYLNKKFGVVPYPEPQLNGLE